MFHITTRSQGPEAEVEPIVAPTIIRPIATTPIIPRLEPHDMTSLLHLNVSGRQYTVPTTLIHQRSHPRPTLLELLSCSNEKHELCDYFDTTSETCYFYGRNPVIFEKVPNSDKEEPAKPKTKEELEQEAKMAAYDNIRYGPFRKKLWLFMEDYTTSCPAKGFAIVSVSFALMSIITMIVGTIPSCEEHNPRTGENQPHYSLILVDHICIAYFCLEYLTRLITTPQRKAYVKETMSIIDVLAIIPSILDIVFDQFSININKLGGIKGAFLALRLLRVLRVFRVFRLARYHSGLQQLGETLKASKKEISVLGVFFTSLVLLFATTVYYLEKDVPDTPFVSIPAACWWCVITITTVGYGDLVPITPGGQLVATVACLAGIIVLAFPITMIIENFNEKYRGATEPPPGEDKPKIKRLKM